MTTREYYKLFMLMILLKIKRSGEWEILIAEGQTAREVVNNHSYYEHCSG
jgi:hypothetical protein